jgi:hypothetical protein
MRKKGGKFMKYTYFLEDGRKIEYDESFWLGKKNISVDGTTLEKPSKKTFLLDEKEYKVKGNFLTGVKLEGENEITVVPALKTWEYILALLPFILVFIGGALGGLIGAVAAIILAGFMRKSQNAIIKVLASLGISVLAFLIWFYLASAVLSIL